MVLPPDYHMHTPLCRHATGWPIEFAGRAVQAGLSEIGFSDHSPMPSDNFDDWRMKFSELTSYVEAVGEARRAFPGLQIKLALEVDFIPGYEKWIQELSAAHPWDYLIGSVHYVDSWALDSPFELDQWKLRDIFDVWSRYFDLLSQAANSGLFDIIAHPDLCKKFGHVPRQDCTPLYRHFLEKAARNGVAIELNTAGLRKECREIYPSLQFLKIARSLDVPITFGSDAHAPEEVGMNFDDAVALARQAGYSASTRFTNRKAASSALRA